jgi:hypothetical protein
MKTYLLIIIGLQIIQVLIALNNTKRIIFKTIRDKRNHKTVFTVRYNERWIKLFKIKTK